MAQLKVIFSEHSNLGGFGLSPRLVSELETTYGKILQLEFEDGFICAQRIIHLPYSYHHLNCVLVPKEWKKLYGLKKDSYAIATIIEPRFSNQLKLAIVPEEEKLKTPAFNKKLLIKEPIFTGMLFKKQKHLVRVKQINYTHNVGILLPSTEVDVTISDEAIESAFSEDDISRNEDGSISIKKTLEDFIKMQLENKGRNDPSDDTGSLDLNFPNLNKIKGIDDAIKRILIEVIYPFQDIIDDNIKEPKPIGGLMLYGPPGCGKTEIAHSIAKDLGVAFLQIDNEKIASPYVHGSSKLLSNFFREAASVTSGIIVFIDEIDSLAGNRSATTHNYEKELVNTLLQELDPKKRPPHVLVIAATNYLSSIDTAVTRSGRFDTKIPIPPPDREGREEILSMLFSDTETDNLSDEEVINFGYLKELSKDLVGYVGSDLNTIRQKAESYNNVRNRTEVKGEAWSPIIRVDVEKAVEAVTPLCETELNLSIPKVDKSDLPGHEGIIDQISMEAKLRIEPERFRSDIKIPEMDGILLHGPPGTGKTSIANAVAKQLGLLFLPIKAGELKDKHVGETGKNISKLFERARLFRPIMIYFDEVDSIASDRSRAQANFQNDSINMLLAEIGARNDNDGILLMAGTNRFNMIDPAFLRPGRFGTHIVIGLPNQAQYAKQVNYHLSSIPNNLTKSEINKLVSEIAQNEFSPSDLSAFFGEIRKYLLLNTKTGEQIGSQQLLKILKNSTRHGKA